MCVCVRESVWERECVRESVCELISHLVCGDESQYFCISHTQSRWATQTSSLSLLKIMLLFSSLLFPESIRSRQVQVKGQNRRYSGLTQTSVDVLWWNIRVWFTVETLDLSLISILLEIKPKELSNWRSEVQLIRCCAAGEYDMLFNK